MKFFPSVPLVLLLFCNGTVGLPEAQTRYQGQGTARPLSATSPPLQAHPEDVAATYQLGVTALKQNKPAEALNYFEKVHGLRPTDIPPLIQMLKCQLALKRRSAARQTTQKLRALLKPEDPLLFEAASLLAQQGDYTAAIPIMEQAKLAFPESYDVSYNLALAYFQSKQYEKSAQVMRLLLKTHPRAEAYNLLATIEEERQNYLEAVRSFQKAAELEPGHEGYRFDYGFELLKHQTLPAAIAVFTSGVRDFPRAVRMRLGLGCAYYLDRNPDEAVKALLAAIKIEPEIVFAYFLLGKMYESAESSQAHIEQAFQSYLDKERKDPWAYYHYARMLQRHVDVDPHPDYLPIRKLLNKALALNPGLAEAHVQLGILLQREGRYEAALPYFRKAIQSKPELDVAHFQLGQTYRRLGLTDKATSEFEIFEKLKTQDQANKEKQSVIQFLVEQRR